MALLADCNAQQQLLQTLPTKQRVHVAVLVAAAMRTCPLHCGPAPMPMVGMRSALVTAAAIGAGMHSSTMAKQPLACSALAWLMTRTASLAT
jgi:hypothetical protein